MLIFVHDLSCLATVTPFEPVDANLRRLSVSVTSPVGPTGIRLLIDPPTRARLSIIATLAIVALAAAGCRPSSDRTGRSAEARPSTSPLETRRGAVIDASRDRIQAVVLDAREEFGDSTFAAIRELGATHITLVSFGFQESAAQPAIRFSPDVRWYSESAAGARAIAARADRFGLRIILKPQIWLRGGSWTADIDFAADHEWAAWESDYRAYLLETAELAAEIDADVLVIGTELSNPVRQRPEFWRTLIAGIRGVYDGKLTYAANWHDDFEHVLFWDALDYIGVNAYFPISDKRRASPTDLQAGWIRHRRILENLAERENRPVLFTELGYRSVAYAASEPWRWPSRDEVGVVDPDYRMQADLYRAFFETVWTAPWFAGAIIWKLYPQNHHRHGSDRLAIDFTPQNKPAEAVIRDAFNATR